MSTNAKRGTEALEAKDYPQAITDLTAAITESPTSPQHHIHRSTAYQKLRQYDSALSDAEKAVVFATQRARRELIAQAQLKRAVALFFLQRYGDARQCLEWSKQSNEKEKMVAVWGSQIEGKVRKLEEGNEMLDVTVVEVPNVDTSKTVPKSNSGATASSEKAPTQPNGSAASPETTAPKKPPPAQTPRDKIRHDWYQNDSTVTFTLLAKGVPKSATVEISETSLSIEYPLESSSDYHFSLDPLYDKVDPAQSSYRILSTKVEVKLRKGEVGRKWHALEGAEPAGNAEQGDAQAKEGDVKAEKGPTYPTSSKKGAKDWDNMFKKPDKDKEKDHQKDKADDDTPANPSEDNPTKPNDDDPRSSEDETYDSDEESSGDPNFFFKKLYSGATDEVKRAMMKSYQESGGTALSTNWEDVRKAPVPVEPPEGMEAHEWEGARVKGKGMGRA